VSVSEFCIGIKPGISTKGQTLTDSTKERIRTQGGGSGGRLEKTA
jgi:hypothetical protein